MTGLTLDEYAELEVVEFPIILGPRTEIQNLRTICESCGEVIKDLKVRCVSHKECVEVYLGGYCSSCSLYESGKMRWYPDQRRVLRFNENGITEDKMTPYSTRDFIKTKITDLKKVIKQLFYYKG